MTYKNAKTFAFFALVAVTMLSASVVGMADAAPNGNASDKAKEKHQEKINSLNKKLAKFQIFDGSSKTLSLDSVENEKEYKELQNELKKAIQDSKKDHKKEFKKNVKEIRKSLKDIGVQTKIIGEGPQGIYLQLDEKYSDQEDNIAKVMGDIPYALEFGEGIKRGACSATTDDCDPEIGGLKVQMKHSSTNASECSLSIPMQRNGIDGFLTAGHCFDGFDYVYQHDATNSNHLLGYSSSSWQSYEDDGNCDCAWIKDTSSTPQQNGVFAYSNSYWMISGTDNPEKGDQAMLRGFHNNNGNWWQSNSIDYENVIVTEDGIDTEGTMLFRSPFQDGDSGGAVFYNGNYLGIAVGSAQINGQAYTAFIPWDNITSNLSGLTL